MSSRTPSHAHLPRPPLHCPHPTPSAWLYWGSFSQHLPRGIDCLWGNFCPGLVIRDFCCCNDISRPVYVWLLQLLYSCGHTLADLRTVPGAPLTFSLRWVCF